MGPDTFNVEKICRVCKLECTEMHCVFENCELSNFPCKLADMLMACASVQIISGDGLPTAMCAKCVEHLSNAYSFKKRCEDADTSFRLLLKQNSIKEENSAEEISNTFFTNALFSPDIIPNLDVKFEETITKAAFLASINISSDKLMEKDKPDGVSFCNNQFQSQASVSKIHRNSIDFLNKCKICAKEYSCLSHLQRHMKLHFPNKMYNCKICNKSLSRLDHLKRHMIIHLKPKPHTCRICKGGFTKADNLHTHQQSCEHQNPYVCKICNRGFAHEDSLQLHMALHTTSHNTNTELQPLLESLDNLEEFIQVKNCAGRVDAIIKPHFLEPNINIEETELEVNSISVTGSNDKGITEVLTQTETNVQENNFDNKQKTGNKRKRAHIDNTSLGFEILESINVPSFSCNICTKSYTRADHLRRHILASHEDYKPFACHLCLKTFTRKDHMSRHVKRHTINEQFECDTCDRKYSSIEHLTKHKAENHRNGDQVVTAKYKNENFNTISPTKNYQDNHFKVHSVEDNRT